MSFSDLSYLQLANAASFAVTACGYYSYDLNVQIALIAIQALNTYIKYTPTGDTHKNEIGYIQQYLSRPLNWNLPLGSFFASPTSIQNLTIANLADNYKQNANPASVAYLVQTRCSDFINQCWTNDCSGTSLPCTFSDALNVPSPAFKDMCSGTSPNTSISNAITNLHLSVNTYNSSSTQADYLDAIPQIQTDISLLNTALNGTTDGYLTVLSNFLNTPILIGVPATLLTLSSGPANALNVALYELGEQSPTSSGGSLQWILNNALSNEFQDDSNCLLNHTKYEWYQHAPGGWQ